ncbi:MAG: C25 family cysteine peptidase [Armatimonadota bacterium]
MRISLVVLVLAVFCVMVPAVAQEVIDFEGFAPDVEIYDQFGPQGVVFPQTPRILSPQDFQPHSGANVLTGYEPGEEFGAPMIVEFSAAQARVKVYVGLMSPSGGNKVEVRAWALNENDQQLGYETVQVGPGPADVDTPIEFQFQLPKIRKLKIEYAGGYFPVIDDLQFATAGPPRAEDRVDPRLTVIKPGDDARLDGFGQYEGAFAIEGTVIEQVKLKEVTISCAHGGEVRTGTLPIANGPPVYNFGSPNVHGLIFEGENLITITARDFAGNTDVEYLHVYYHPLIGQAELLVLTPAEFYDALVPLEEWKNSSGISCHVMTLEAIQADSRFDGVRDLPERVKRALAHAYNNHGTRYAMLVGDGDRFPLRFHRTGRVNVSWGVVWPATELYYADLFKADGSFDNWDGNGNNIIGEWWQGTAAYEAAANFDQMNVDDCDLHPDIAVGRVPASTVNEVANYVYKVVEYEMQGRQAWFDRAVLWNGSRDFRSDEIELDNVSATYLSDFTPHKHYRPAEWESWDHDTRSAYEHGEWVPAIASDLNQGAGLAVCFDHGGDWVMGVLTNAHIDSLNNESKWPVAVACACDTARFIWINGYYEDVDGNLPDSMTEGWGGPEIPNPEPAPIQPSVVDHESLAERWLCSDLSGAVGFLGATMGVNTASPPYVKCFLEGWKQGHRRLGNLWTFGVNRFLNQYLEAGHWFGKSPLQSHHLHKYVLFGDPSLRIGQIPVQTMSSQAQAQTQQLRAIVQQLPARFRPDVHSIRCPRFSSDGNVTISGSAPPGRTVEAAEGRRRIGKAKADDRGRFAISLTGLSEGAHTVRLSAGPGIAPKPKRVTAAIAPHAGTDVRFEVHRKNPTVEGLKYPKTCAGNTFMVQGKTQYDGTYVELWENGKPFFGDYSRNGGHFVLQPMEALSKGQHTLSLHLECGAGRQTVMEDCITVTVGDAKPQPQPVRPIKRPTVPKLPK